MVIEENINEVIRILPAEIVSKIDLLIILIQAIGGIFTIYVLFIIIRFFMTRNQGKIIKEIRDDVKFIKNKIKKKNKS